MSKTGQPTFALVHGSWHNDWCMNLVQDELEDQGYKTISPNLPTEDPTKSFDDYARILAEEFYQEKNVVGVFHSRAANYGPRAINILRGTTSGRNIVQKMIFLAASYDDSTVAALNRPAPNEIVPARNSDISKRAILARPDLGVDMTELDLSLAAEILYHDVDEAELVQQALKNLRPQYRPQTEKAMKVWPSIPQEFIICTDDRMVRPEWSDFVARNWLGLDPVTIDAGHSPFLSRPKELAQLLIEIHNPMPTQRMGPRTSCKA